MAHSCVDCGRVNSSHMSVCIYCGGGLPGAGTSSERQLPADLDELVRQAMATGATHKLQEAMLAHGGAPTTTETLAEEDHKPVDRGGDLKQLAAAAARALKAHEADDAAGVHAALVDASSVLGQFGDLTPRPVDLGSAAVEPVTLLPKVRRRFALVTEGPGDVERATEIADALGVDGVTARMLAIARQPRIVLRGDHRDRLDRLAEKVRAGLNLHAVVVETEDLREFGQARLLVTMENGPHAVNVNDWEAELSGLADQVDAQLVNELPLLVVPGEVVLLKFRPVRSGGRLKHLREGRVHPATERRLAVADLHTASGIVRLVEGATSITDVPGAVEGSFRSTLRILLDNWAEQEIRTLDGRTASPANHNSHGRFDDNGDQRVTGWPEWEEHSRAARALFMGLRSGLESP